MDDFMNEKMITLTQHDLAKACAEVISKVEKDLKEHNAESGAVLNWVLSSLMFSGELKCKLFPSDEDKKEELTLPKFGDEV